MTDLSFILIAVKLVYQSYLSQMIFRKRKIDSKVVLYGRYTCITFLYKIWTYKSPPRNTRHVEYFCVLQEMGSQRE